jgi:hypothetical protein
MMLQALHGGTEQVAVLLIGDFSEGNPDQAHFKIMACFASHFYIS